MIRFKLDHVILSKTRAGKVLATAFSNFVGMPWKAIVPDFMGHGEILKTLIIMLSGIEDHNIIASENQRTGNSLHLGGLGHDGDAFGLSYLDRLDGEARKASV
jgi:hypothetical protein